MESWQLQEAKSKFSELVKKATTEGPQTVSVRGQDQVVVISKKYYEELFGRKKSFLQLIFDSPLKGIELDLERNKSMPRDIQI